MYNETKTEIQQGEIREDIPIHVRVERLCNQAVKLEALLSAKDITEEEQSKPMPRPAASIEDKIASIGIDLEKLEQRLAELHERLRVNLERV